MNAVEWSGEEREKADQDEWTIENIDEATVQQIAQGFGRPV